MNVNRNAITADLGSGSFELDRLTVSFGSAVSEIRLLSGVIDRKIVGGTKKLILEGRYGIGRDGAFFRTMLSGLRGNAVSNAVIGGVTYASLYAEKAVMICTDDSGIGRFVITLCEL